jgi:hypothetical protein
MLKRVNSTDFNPVSIKVGMDSWLRVVSTPISATHARKVDIAFTGSDLHIETAQFTGNFNTSIAGDPAILRTPEAVFTKAC